MGSSKKSCEILSLIFVIFFCISCSRACAESKVILFLDPGHGGTDQGGYDGRGFKNENGNRIPEDGYTYDVAKRIQRLAQQNRWETIFTVFDREDAPLDYDENRILPPKTHATYQPPFQYLHVFPGKEGLTKRLAVLTRMPNMTDTIAIFISIHFDYAHPEFSGTRIFTSPSLSKHPFVLILAKKFSEEGLAAKFKGKITDMIDSRNQLFMLKENPVTARVLIELGNFNDPRDRALMLGSAGRERYAEIIIRAIREYMLHASLK